MISMEKSNLGGPSNFGKKLSFAGISLTCQILLPKFDISQPSPSNLQRSLSIFLEYFGTERVIVSSLVTSHQLKRCLVGAGRKYRYKGGRQTEHKQCVLI